MKTIENNSFKEIWDRIKISKRVAMTLHYAPDGDSLGSCAALKYVLERDFKIKITVVSYDALDETLMSLPYAKEVKFGTDISELKTKDYDLFIFLDSGSISGKLKDDYRPPKDVFIINIDHHPTNKYVNMVSMNYIDVTRPAACSILMDLFKSVGVKFDKELSTRLLLGLCTDTGFFRYNANSALMDASFLIATGGDYQFMISNILENVPFKMKKYYALLAKNFKTIRINGNCIGYSSISNKNVRELDLNRAEIRLGVNWLSDIKECDIVITLADLKDHVKGSFRSRKDIDVSKFAVLLGGGGHKAAAAFFFHDISLKEAEKKVLSVLRKNL